MLATNKIVRLMICLLIATSFAACKQEIKSSEIKSNAESLQKKQVSEDDHKELFERAKYYFDRKNYDGAIADLSKAIKLDSLQPDYYHLLSDSYMDYFRSKKALMTMEAAAELFPERIPTLLKLSETQLILKQHEPSLMTVAKVLSLQPNNADGHFMKGMNFRGLEETEKAIGAFQTTTELDPGYVDAWLIAGDLLYDKGQKLALDYYNAALNADPNSITALHSKAYYLQNDDKENEAIKIYRKIIGLDKSYDDAYLNSGILYMTMDSLDAAMEQFNILVSIKPENHLPYYYRGLIYESQGNISAARTELQNCVNLNSDFSKAKKALNNLSAS